MGGGITEVEPALVHQHTSGEVFRAENLEAARGLCPVLGKLSLEEAGLLLELEALGNETLETASKAPKNEKTVIEKPLKAEKELPQTELLDKSLPPLKARDTQPSLADKPEASRLVAHLSRQEMSTSTATAEKVVDLLAPRDEFEKPEVVIQPDESLLVQKITNDTQHALLLGPETVGHTPEVTGDQPSILAYHDVIEVAPPTATAVSEQTILVEPEPAASIDRQETVVAQPPQLDHPEASETALFGADDLMPEEFVSEPESPGTSEALLLAPDVVGAEAELSDPTSQTMPAVFERPTVIPILVTHEEGTSSPSTAEMVQTAMIENLLHAVSDLEPDAAVITHELLDSAVERIQEITSPRENYEAAKPHETEIVEMFIEIFEQAGLQYSQEQITTFAHNIVATELDTDTPNTALMNYALSDYGTHEGLVYLLKTSQPLKKLKATLHTALGRLVLLSPTMSTNEYAVVTP